MKQAVKYMLFGLLVLLLLFPTAQQHYGFFEMVPLKGAVPTYIQPAFKWKSFFRSTYQDQFTTYLEHNIGLRPFLVRLNNQLNYSLFGKLSAQGVVKGKEGYLFEINYIKALHGLDFVGWDKVNEDVRKTKTVANWLQQHDKHLLVVLAPGKGTFFPEYSPARYKTAATVQTNAEAYHKLLMKEGIPVINGNNWFRAIKEDAPYPLFPKLGIHWSYYGMGLVFDSLINTMEWLHGERFVDFNMQNIEMSHDLRTPDRDLWEGLNTFSSPKDYPMPYPEFTFNQLADARKPSVILIGDSYYWQWFGSGFSSRAFGPNTFWYYNSQIFDADGSEPLYRQEVDLLEEVEAADFIIILQTDANMNRYSFGFMDDLYKAIVYHTEHSDPERNNAIKAIMKEIRQNPDYMNLIREKAIERGITSDEMMRIDATWIYERRLQGK